MHFNIFNNHFGRSKIILLSLAASLYAHAETTEVNQNDSVRIYGLDEVVITSSTRETNPLQSLPGAATLISPQQVQGMNL
ncbi:MAG: hypothetical protein LBR66_02745, partial [Candidatus Symbiothrix sp.]|nr:hypothetical protein [Candidatus Symbiothrix sp.]